MLKGMGRMLAHVVLYFSILLSFAHADATTREIRWVGCGISRVGFMQDLADAYQKKTGIKVVIDGGGATRGIREVANHASDLGGSCRLPLVYQSGDGSWNVESQEKQVKMIPICRDAQG